MESVLATDANNTDEEDMDMDFFDDDSSDGDSSDDDSEASVTEELLVILLALKATEKLFRWNEERLDWDAYVRKLNHRKEFQKTFRMEESSFNLLCTLLRPSITVDVTRARASGAEPIYPELVMAIGLRWLAGGQWADICNSFCVSKASMYRIRNLFLDAVMDCDALAIKFPETVDELTDQARRFASKSSADIIRGCVGAIDGILICIIQPTRNNKGTYEVINVRDFFSGHYKRLGLNVQAVSDERLRFLYAGVAMPGSQPDCSAYAVTSLKKKVESLPPGFHLVGDNAYVLSEHMLIPYSGSQRDDPAKSTYNYFLSQLRIRVEQTFARFTGKFRIFKKPLDVNLKNATKIILACARLHNFIIDNDQVDDYEPDAAPCEGELARGMFGEEYSPTINEFRSEEGTSVLRQRILANIEREGLRRPNYNVVRSSFERYEDRDLM